MIARKSAIKLNSFSVLKSHFEFVHSKRVPKSIQKLFESYELDIDFAHHFEDNGTIRVFVKIAVNQQKKPLPGYKLFVEAVGLFHLEDTDIPEKEQNNLKYYSTVSILIGYLRNSLAANTASAPFGPYLLPPVDMNELFRQKSGECEKVEN
jgi:preprotein translocase subunit SecB